MIQFVLDCFYRPAADLKDAQLEFALTNTGQTTLKSFTLAYTALTRAARTHELDNADGLLRLANFHEVTPPDGLELEPGATWTFAIRGLANPARHRLDGPKSGYVSCGGAIIDVVCNDLETTADLDTGERKSLPAGRPDEPLHIVPWPQSVEISDYRTGVSSVLITSGTVEEKAAANKINALSRRLFPGCSLSVPVHQFPAPSEDGVPAGWRACAGRLPVALFGRHHHARLWRRCRARLRADRPGAARLWCLPRSGYLPLSVQGARLKTHQGFPGAAPIWTCLAISGARRTSCASSISSPGAA
ncbi:hypothetical protein QW131_08145 [Roseibium salinum]|nr:hypothetical protein [Roseibium salinum]